MDRLKELYAQKGEAQTQFEIAQARIQSINQEILKILNQPKPIMNNTPETVTEKA